MEVVKIYGKEVRLHLGYYKDSDGNKSISLVFVDLMWNPKTKRAIIGIGIPFVFAIGVYFYYS